MILTTKYSGPTNTRGSRVLVYCSAGRARSVACDPALVANENHDAAAFSVACTLDALNSENVKPRQILSHESYELLDACNHSRVHVFVPSH